ncbi:MAG TPA: hypothetical protein VE866_04770 [Candidatus Binatia bacterium]|nr:hypothetical protein [Candidatus Binatia bacterium]
MAVSKSSTLTLRIEPSLKEALRIAAVAEHRSIANLVEVLIRDHCKEKGISIQDGLNPQANNESRQRASRKG